MRKQIHKGCLCVFRSECRPSGSALAEVEVTLIGLGKERPKPIICDVAFVSSEEGAT